MRTYDNGSEPINVRELKEVSPVIQAENRFVVIAKVGEPEATRYAYSCPYLGLGFGFDFNSATRYSVNADEAQDNYYLLRSIVEAFKKRNQEVELIEVTVTTTQSRKCIDVRWA